MAPSAQGRNSASSDAASRNDGVEEVGMERQERVRDGTRGLGLETLGVGMSTTIMEEFDMIERACLQRTSALKEEEPFVDALGRGESPVELPQFL